MTNYQKVLDNALVKEDSVSRLEGLDCVIFDCDGTLVNINNSYNACIKHTAGIILEQILGGNQWYDLVTDEIILKFRMSGGFNNDTDTTYASILSAIAANTDDVELAQKFVLNIATHADERGITSIEQYLSEIGFNETVKKIKDKLKYPGLADSSLLSRAFDEFFYGKELFTDMYGQQPKFNDSKGFIDKDEVIISSDKLDQISAMFNGKIAIVSGRGRLATEYTLRPILHYFNLDASVFIEDEEKRVIKEKLNLKVTKPYPYALLRAIEVLQGSKALCIGDSVEDMLMARKASESASIETVFCGVYGAVSNSNFQFKVFTERGVDLILEDINALPQVLQALKH